MEGGLQNLLANGLSRRTLLGGGFVTLLLTRAPFALFILSILFFAFSGGIVVHKYGLFPMPLLQKAQRAAKDLSVLLGVARHQYYRETYMAPEDVTPIAVAERGSTLVASVAKDRRLLVQVVDGMGEAIHDWKVDWFEIWPDPKHLPQKEIPRIRPGTHVHGMTLMDNGDLIFNFEHLGLVRLDACGKVVWRLDYRTHHSIHQSEDGNLWISGQVNHETRLAGFPNYVPPFIEPTILEVSPAGKIIQEISVMRLLKTNDIHGLLYMGTLVPEHTEVSGDTLHLNDVEVFPSSLMPGVFEAGDIMISLRNINAVLVFSQDDQRVKYLSIGRFVRQHDPDFVDGNTISVFDNNNVSRNGYDKKSRILMVSANNDETKTYFEGSKGRGFHTNMMGKHQWLGNGNLLITESTKGRAFEIDGNGNVVWEFVNLVEDGWVGWVEEAQRLDAKYNRSFFEQRSKACAG